MSRDGARSRTGPRLRGLRLGARLWLLGALVPALGTLVLLVLAGQWFRSHLEAGLDRALLAQAAVESVSLFDGPAGRPHLHMATSPLVDSVRPFAPSGDLFGPDGRLVMSYPPRPAHPNPPEHSDHPGDDPRLLPGSPGEPPRLSTSREPDGSRRRDLTVTVAAPAGGLYTLRLRASLSQLDASTRAFSRVTLSGAVLFALGLILLQTLHARTLRARLERLAAHMAALREGDFEHAPPPDRGADEIAELGAVIAEATAKLRAARAGEKRLVADAAHELRTPLTLMRTSLDLALRRPREPAELRAALFDARREVDRLTALCKSLLDLSAIGQAAWDRTTADLADLAQDAVVAARAEAEARGLLITLHTGRPAPARVHEGGVRQALDNLLSNALKFAPRGSTVEVAVQRSGTSYRLTVRDHGPGIAAEQRENVFAPFHRARAAPAPAGDDGDPQPGHGLGLTIAREIAVRHGGRLSVSDAPGWGAVLLLELPCA